MGYLIFNMNEKWRKPEKLVSESAEGSETRIISDITESEEDAGEDTGEPPQPEKDLAAEAEQSSNSEQIPGYELLQVIGQGASGAVYAANHCSDGQKAAIKIFNKELTPDRDARRRFEQEVDTLSKLMHPNIVRILDCGATTSGESYIVMEMVEGASIRVILDTEGVFQPQRAAAVAREICRALAAAHAEGIIHRDLKPNNIILDDRNFAKVIDFGIAKAVGSSTDTITQYGAVIGTPAYMSPEQCLGQKVDARSDIYSLGCTLFEMLTGQRAFDSNNAVEAIAKQIDKDRSHIRHLLRSTAAPPSLQAIVVKCLERDANRRYNTVAELDHDLSAFLLGLQPPYAGPRKNFDPTPLAAGLALIAFLMAGMNWWTGPGWQFFDALAGRPAAENSQPLPAQPPTTPWGQGIVIRDRFTNKILFSDPSAKNLGQALQNAGDQKISLRGANLHDANLVQTQLHSVDLSLADLSAAQFIQSKLNDVDLHGAILNRANFTQATMANINMRNAELEMANLTQVRAPGLMLAGANLNSARLSQAHLERSYCRSTNFSQADMTQASLDEADCTDANFRNARTSQTRFRNTNLNAAQYLDSH